MGSQMTLKLEFCKDLYPHIWLNQLSARDQSSKSQLPVRSACSIK